MKTIQVSEAYKISGKSSITVSEDADLEYIAAYLGHEHHIQGVFVTDSQQRFIGIISRLDLLRWM